jgi:hypothetical protein
MRLKFNPFKSADGETPAAIVAVSAKHGRGVVIDAGLSERLMVNTEEAVLLKFASAQVSLIHRNSFAL